jgi:phospholipase/carboxylesterase
LIPSRKAKAKFSRRLFLAQFLASLAACSVERTTGDRSALKPNSPTPMPQSKPLKLRTIPASKNKSGVLIALHGWGANGNDLVPLAPELSLPDYELIFPEAPFDHPHVSGGKMWYDLQDPDRGGLAESRQMLAEFLNSLPKTTGIPLSRTVLLGFSQGGAMTLDVGLRLPLAGLVSLSGYLHPIATPPNSAIPPILIVHGKQDAVVPLKAAQTARDTLIGLGAKIKYLEYDMGHEIRPEAIAQVRQFVQGLK